MNVFAFPPITKVTSVSANTALTSICKVYFVPLTMGTIKSDAGELQLGAFAGGNSVDGKIGETKIDIATNADYTAAQILTAFKRGQSGKHFLETGNEVAWYKFKGNNNTDFLSDETGNNDLTGTNVTQSDDQVKLKKYKD